MAEISSLGLIRPISGEISDKTRYLLVPLKNMETTKFEKSVDLEKTLRNCQTNEMASRIIRA